ncbi:MAG: GNAT family N-acetyltransferase [Polyangiaceae bacterium]
MQDPKIGGSEERLVIRAALPSEIEWLRAIDDDACSLHAEHGLVIAFPTEHEYARIELARWLRSAELGRAFLAVGEDGTRLGFAALDLVDGEPYLDQLSVRVAAMRRGIGGRLLALAADWARVQGKTSVWLTTYAHLPFNRPYYERHGYRVVPEAECGPGIVAQLDEQRSVLPLPEQRIAMRRDVARS